MLDLSEVSFREMKLGDNVKTGMTNSIQSELSQCKSREVKTETGSRANGDLSMSSLTFISSRRLVASLHFCSILKSLSCLPESC